MKIFNKFEFNRKTKIVILSIICLLAVLIYFLPDNSNKNQDERISNNTTLKSSAEEDLEKVLSNIKGAGKVKVMITYDNGVEDVFAVNTEKKTDTVSEKSANGKSKNSETVTESKTLVTFKNDNGEEALVIVENEPKVKGVIVVAQGADNVNVKLDLQKAVETILQIKSSQVEIFVMK